MGAVSSSTTNIASRESTARETYYQLGQHLENALVEEKKLQDERERFRKRDTELQQHMHRVQTNIKDIKQARETFGRILSANDTDTASNTTSVSNEGDGRGVVEDIITLADTDPQRDDDAMLAMADNEEQEAARTVQGNNDDAHPNQHSAAAPVEASDTEGAFPQNDDEIPQTNQQRTFSDGREWVTVAELQSNPDLIGDEFWQRETIKCIKRRPVQYDIVVFSTSNGKSDFTTSASDSLPSFNIAKAQAVAERAAREYASSIPDFKGDFTIGNIKTKVGSKLHLKSLSDLHALSKGRAVDVAKTLEGPRVLLIPMRYTDEFGDNQPLHFKYNKSVQNNLGNYADHFGSEFLKVFTCYISHHPKSPRLAQLRKQIRAELLVRISLCVGIVDVDDIDSRLTLKDLKTYFETNRKRKADKISEVEHNVGSDDDFDDNEEDDYDSEKDEEEDHDKDDGETSSDDDGY